MSVIWSKLKFVHRKTKFPPTGIDKHFDELKQRNLAFVYFVMSKSGNQLKNGRLMRVHASDI